MATHRKIDGSERPAPREAFLHAAPPDETVQVSIYLKDQEPDPLTDPNYQPRSAEALKTKREALYGPQLDKIAAFATETGLTVCDRDPMRRRLVVCGPACQLEAAFGTKLGYYGGEGQAPFRARVGALSAPAELADNIEAVLGFDTRPIATPKLRFNADPHAATEFTPNKVAKLYQFPAGGAAGQCIGIIELGGGFRASDNALAFKAMGLPVPKITAISVSGGRNRPGVDSGADGEVALDIQVAGGAAPGAALAVYFAPNTTQGFVDAITHAVSDAQHKPSVLSISWGSAEDQWTQQTINAMDTAFRDAARVGVTVCAASGDNLATDGERDGKAHADYPASDPYVVGCGGTFITVQGAKIHSEVVWNRAGTGTGGGFSSLFPAPPYQTKAIGHATQRGVPDVSADADPESGYAIVVGGVGGAIGGTSAVAPLWAALFALINQAAGRRIGLPHAALYAAAPRGFHDIVKGDNRAGQVGFAAQKGWDPCTGLGSPIGSTLVEVFTAAAKPPKAKAHAP